MFEERLGLQKIIKEVYFNSKNKRHMKKIVESVQFYL